MTHESGSVSLVAKISDRWIRGIRGGLWIPDHDKNSFVLKNPFIYSKHKNHLLPNKAKVLRRSIHFDLYVHHKKGVNHGHEILICAWFKP